MATRFAASAQGSVVGAPGAARGAFVPPEADLVERLRKGDARALEHLVSAYWAPLVRYAEHIVGLGAGDDAAQCAFLRLWLRRESLGATGSLRSLLYTMVRNAAVDECRREQRLSARAAVACELAPVPPSPLAEAEASELARLAEAAVSHLAPRRQEVFRLVREHGLSYADVAEVMGLSVQTVANHMSLALAALRKALGPTLVEPAAGPRVIGG